MDQSQKARPCDNRVLLSVNPRAGRRGVEHQVRELADSLTRRGLEVEAHENLDSVSQLANCYFDEGALRALVAVGGDGTVAELLNRTRPGVRLAVYPTGTSNLLARQLGIFPRVESVAETVASGRLLHLDAGRAGERLFLLMLSCGFDAEVVRRLHGRRGTRGGGHISYWSYLKPILQSIRSYGCPELRIDCDPPCGGVQGKAGRPFLARWAFLFNLPRYAWGLPLAPEAVGHDGWMELYTFAHGTFFHGLWYAACAQAGWHSRLPDCARRRVRRVRIAAQQPVPYQLDGDPAGELPVEVEVQPGRVTLLVPRTYSSRSA